MPQNKTRLRVAFLKVGYRLFLMSFLVFVFYIILPHTCNNALGRLVRIAHLPQKALLRLISFKWREKAVLSEPHYNALGR